ncbi:hypothetical protein OG596_35305 [Streptomyces sp. NBC_01102]|uniref:hypothetical protein n=1 Tax=Streptomyces sp. NBC_01102 TaxID=2903749 RepID=UPI00386FB0A4|nr:hypothetical protein OG596_35305 [Streptomyces sp. NBC_01102]
MSEAMQAEERLKLAQWHLSRSDQLRLGLISRASTLLSANALVMTGIAFISSSTTARTAVVIGASALIALVVSAYSVIQLTGVLTGSRTLSTLSRPPDSPAPIAFSYGDTINEYRSLSEFEEKFLAQSAEEAANSAILELWSCINLHQLRTIKLQRATRCLLTSAIILVVITAEKMLFGLF